VDDDHKLVDKKNYLRGGATKRRNISTFSGTKNKICSIHRLYI